MQGPAQHTQNPCVIMPYTKQHSLPTILDLSEHRVDCSHAWRKHYQNWEEKILMIGGA